MTRRFGCLLSLVWLGCGPSVPAADVSAGGATVPSDRAPADGQLPPSATPTASPAHASAEAAAAPANTKADLPASTWKDVERSFDKPVVFIAPGRDGRLGVIADEAGQAVPWILEGGAWKRLPLPDAHAAPIAKLVGGIYFGRDDRPRLMGTVNDGGLRMVYLRFKGGKWRPEPKEIGRLGKAPAAELFGVLGWDDPEVVCKTGDVCLIKSRKGWQEVEPTIVASAVVRAFGGKGYAATEKGLFRAEKKGFARVGPAAPWKSAPAGFWVDADGTIAVTEPAANAIHVLDAKAGAWTREESPLAGPQDVAGPASARIVVGAGGMARFEGGAWHRVGDASWKLRFVLTSAEPAGSVFVAGESGVIRLAKP